MGESCRPLFGHGPHPSRKWLQGFPANWRHSSTTSCTLSWNDRKLKGSNSWSTFLDGRSARFDKEGTLLYHGMMQWLSTAFEASAQIIWAIDSAFEYPLIREKRDPSLSMKISNLDEAMRRPHSMSATADDKVSNSPITVCLPSTMSGPISVNVSWRPNQQVTVPEGATKTAPRPAPLAGSNAASVIST